MIKVAFAYDVERPYGRFTMDFSLAARLREDEINSVLQITRLLDKEGIPRTFFIIGSWLDSCVDPVRHFHLTARDMQGIFSSRNSLNDLQQHTYSHLHIRPLPEKNEPPVSPTEFAEDVRKASGVLWEILGIKPEGLSMPYGYERDLSDMPELLAGLKQEGIKFLCGSEFRGGDKPLYGELSLSRQPHTYEAAGFPEIVEIPGHGPQDVIYTGEKAKIFLGKESVGQAEILNDFRELFSRAVELSKSREIIYVCLGFHPWAIWEYDKGLEIHKRIIEIVRGINGQFVSCRQIADEIRKSQ